MLNKILVFGGLALAAILIIENMVGGAPAYLFIEKGSHAWKLSLTSIIIGIGIGFGIKGMITTQHDPEADGYDF